MFRKYISILFIVLVVNLLGVFPVIASTKEEKEAQFAEKVKANIAKLGTGKDARVEVKLKDGTKLKGYVSKIDDESFVVTDAKTGTETTVLYPQTKQIKGNNLNTGAKIAIGIGIGVGATLLFIYLYIITHED